MYPVIAKCERLLSDKCYYIKCSGDVSSNSQCRIFFWKESCSAQFSAALPISLLFPKVQLVHLHFIVSVCLHLFVLASV